MKPHALILGLATAVMTGCATVATATLDNRLQALGLPADTASCMATDLNENMSREDVFDLTRYTYSLSQAGSALAVVRSLMTIENPRAVTAVGKAGFNCLKTGFLK